MLLTSQNTYSIGYIHSSSTLGSTTPSSAASSPIAMGFGTSPILLFLCGSGSHFQVSILKPNNGNPYVSIVLVLSFILFFF